MIVIETKGIIKDFVVHSDRPKTLKETFLRIGKKKEKTVFRALDGVSISIMKGQSVGLIGRNGSGKSTLLKVISKILYPEQGDVKIQGRMTSLLELGAGFHPDFTGIENIYMNASLFGLSKKEVTAKLDDIIAYSELGEFIYRPIRTYSSGMYMRLAFSIAINVDPDILIIDEVLAVGDSSFQQKCINSIAEFKEKGRTIVIVTHDHSTIEKLCNRCIWLKNGKLQLDGHPKEVIVQYLDNVASEENNKQVVLHQLEKEASDNIGKTENSTNRWGNDKVSITRFTITDEKNNEKFKIKTGEKVFITMDYEVNGECKDISFGVGLFRNDGLCCYGTNTDIDNIKVDNFSNKGSVEFIIESFDILPGEYWFDLAAHSKDGDPYDYITKARIIQTYTDLRDIGISRIKHKWIFK